MSTEVVEPSQPDGDRAAGSPPRRSTSGLSLTAQGEPLIWLTGGALTICVAMILGLLGLVCWSGLSTFWPVPLLQVEDVDGARQLGEVTRRETYTLTAAMAERLPETRREAARRHLAGRQEAPAIRRLLRTGNFELTNEHFQWISDFEIREGSESHPAWAIIAERVEWGRFYGEPRQFALVHERPLSEDEAELAALVAFFAVNRRRLSPEEASELDDAKRELAASYERVRADHATRYLDEFAEQDGLQLLVDGRPVSRDQRSPNEGLTGVQQVWSGPSETWDQFERFHGKVRDLFQARRDLEENEVGHVNALIEEARLALKRQQLREGVSGVVEGAAQLHDLQRTVNGVDAFVADVETTLALLRSRFGDNTRLVELAEKIALAVRADAAQQRAGPLAEQGEIRKTLASTSPELMGRLEHFLEVNASAEERIRSLQVRIDELNRQIARHQLTFQTSGGIETTLSLGDVVRAYPANQLTFGDKVAVYFSRWGEFLTDDPREANSEGGVFPAIWGTVVMTLIMSLVVVPFGVFAALYLREYAKGGLLISTVRVAINNLAGVPSIVFGVFGLSFFCYRIGAFVDGGPANAGIAPWPAPWWFFTLTCLAVLSAVAFAGSLYAFTGQRGERSRLKRGIGRCAAALWVAATVGFVLTLAATPYFDGFYQANLPNPYFGRGGLLWASLTLALLTLPVVIVATEEALSAVPNSLREGSYACGAGKWQTIRRIVLPHALPGIMTGMILAMARGAGEVAPLMLVGAVKLAPELPVALNDWSGTLGPVPTGPFHLDRSFMHLGFHIYDLGFQSQNSEAAKPMVFTTTLLLIALIATLNLVAIALRAQLRKRFHTGQF